MCHKALKQSLLCSEEGDVLLGCATYEDMSIYEAKCQEPSDASTDQLTRDAKKVCFCKDDLCNSAGGLNAALAAVLAALALNKIMA